MPQREPRRIHPEPPEAGDLCETRCVASGIHGERQCLICGSTIDAASEHREGIGTLASGKHEAKEQTAQASRSRSEREDRILAQTRHDAVSMPDYEWYVELGAKGMAQRDNHPMPKSVTTPEEFYEIMSAAALDAIGLRTLLSRLARAERELELTRDSLRKPEANAEHARHQRRSDESER